MRHSIAGVGRHGLPSYEKAALVLDDGKRLDLSILVTELDGRFFSADWWTAVSRLDLSLLPVVSPEARIASCLERPASVTLVENVAGEAASTSLTDFTRLAGANDPVCFGRAELHCTAGVALISGEGDAGRAPPIAGLSSFLIVESVQQEASQDPIHDMPIYLGPVIVAPMTRISAKVKVRVAAGAMITAIDVALPGGRFDSALTAAGPGLRQPGALVLVAAVRRGSLHLHAMAGDEIRLEAGSLGTQIHPVLVDR